MKFDFLKTENIYPEGWIYKQLKTQSDGLCGNLDKVWPDVKDSKWLGGDHEGWERLPYFLDGYIPMAYLLRDEDKMARSKKYISYILLHQADDGCFYPKGEEGKNGDIWSLFLINKVLTVYADCSGEDKEVEYAVYKCLKFLDEYIDRKTPYDWAQSRWYECIIPIIWIYKRRKEEWLIYLARRLKALGVNFDASISLWDRVKKEWAFDTHVVNIAMALKSEAVYCEITGEKPIGLAEKMLETLFKYHGTAYGHFSGDECLSGNSPSRGSELCGVVEAMYSYEWLTACTGESKWVDLLERVAFNGLPAAITGDMWGHQYDQQVNQIASLVFNKQIFNTNGPDANVFGLEPHYGCCTANFGQGWPKFILSAYMKKGDALVVNCPLPMTVKLNGISVKCKSEYPFRKTFSLVADGDIEILLRIPRYNQDGKSGGYESVSLRKGQEYTGTFEMQPSLIDRPNGRKCLYYGPLLFSLPIGYERNISEYERDGVERKFPFCDYTYAPKTEWRYAFAGDKFDVVECEYDKPFDKINPPLKIKGTFVKTDWEFSKDYDYVPDENGGKVRAGDNEIKEAVPYGATYLRITEMSELK